METASTATKRTARKTKRARLTRASMHNLAMHANIGAVKDETYAALEATICDETRKVALRAQTYAEHCKRSVVAKKDVAAAISDLGPEIVG
jgi:histone H3/H4